MLTFERVAELTDTPVDNIREAEAIRLAHGQASILSPCPVTGRPIDETLNGERILKMRIRYAGRIARLGTGGLSTRSSRFQRTFHDRFIDDVVKGAGR